MVGAAALLVEAAPPTGLQSMLRRNDFGVVAASTAELALFEFGRSAFDCVVASMALTGMGTIGLCSELRRRGRTPIIVVGTSITGSWLDALDAGADDHLDLPCDDRELTARLRALVRRSQGSLTPTHTLRIGRAQLLVRGDTVDLDPDCLSPGLQHTVLHHLATRPGAVVSAETLGQRVGDRHGAGSADRLDAELEQLSVTLALASGVADVLQHVPEAGWRLNVGDVT